MTACGACAGVLGLLLFIPAFELGSGLHGNYPPMNEAGLQMLHDMYLDTGNTTGFWEALQAYKSSSTYRLVCFPVVLFFILTAFANMMHGSLCKSSASM